MQSSSPSGKSLISGILSWDGPPVTADELYRDFLSSGLSEKDIKGVRIGMSISEVESTLGIKLKEGTEKKSWSNMNNYRVYVCPSYSGSADYQGAGGRNKTHTNACLGGRMTFGGAPIVDMWFVFIKEKLAVARLYVFSDLSLVNKGMTEKYGILVPKVVHATDRPSNPWGPLQGKPLPQDSSYLYCCLYFPPDAEYQAAFSKFVRFKQPDFFIGSSQRDQESAKGMLREFIQEHFLSPRIGNSNIDFRGDPFPLILRWTPFEDEGAKIYRSSENAKDYLIVQGAWHSSGGMIGGNSVGGGMTGNWLSLATSSSLSAHMALRDRLVMEMRSEAEKRNSETQKKRNSDM